MSLLVGRSVRRSVLTIATEDHNIPTVGSIEPIVDPVSRAQVEALRANAPEFGVPPLGDADQGGRAHHRSPTGSHPAGDDCRLW